ncbi:MAG TPA: hypothetical protein VFI31_09000 [Pirellulales bacterium]|nr:hypothetical protein [Pirellulales bacterium]
MSLAAAVQKHRDSVLAELAAVHDYYANTKRAWRIVQGMVSRRGRFSAFNAATGNRTTEQDLPQKAQLYVADYLAGATFQQFVSLFEDFTFGILQCWLLAYPQRLGRKQIPASIVLGAADLDEVKLAIVNRELNEIKYRNVRDWFAEMGQVVKLGCPTDDEIERLAEIKASRDVLVRNRGVANAIYEEKSAGRKRFSTGQKLEIPETYHRESWELIRKVVGDVSTAALGKAPN